MAVWLAASAILAFRNPAAFRAANFYAEDATIFVNNILLHPFTAIATAFNGYLVVGEYIVGYVAVIIAKLAGGGVAAVPLTIAVVSSLTLGLCVSLPFILFRRDMGVWVALAAVLVGALVPLETSGYAVIGTIGNLKFAFVYAAFLLILYRNTRIHLRSRLYWIDAILLLCVLTNIFVIALLPFILWPYRQQLIAAVRKRDVRKLQQDSGILSAIVLLALAGLYTLIIYIAGIPPLTGYLDQPYQRGATLPLLDRVTNYAWLYPITGTMQGRVVLLILVLTVGSWWLARRQDRVVIAFGLWAIISMTVLFVANRTGVSAYYLGFNHRGGPDQFFYAQNLLYVFLPFWLVREWFTGARVRYRIMSGLVLMTYLVWAVPIGTERAQGNVLYKDQPAASQAIPQACRGNGETVRVRVRPTSAWEWQAPRSEICNGIRL